MLALLLLVVVSFTGAGASSGAIDYADQAGWPTLCVTGTRQSPIDIKTPDKFITSRKPLLRLPKKADNAKLTNGNNANTIKFAIAPEMKIRVPGLKHIKATVVQLHIHWGVDESEGSEHLLDGAQFAAESHLVTSYVNKKDGTTNYAVFARFFKVGEANEQVGQMIAAQLSSGDERNIESFDLSELYPRDTESILTYEGSFTTPGCDEIAHWVVVPEPLEISEEQLERLRELPLGDGSGHELQYNWRDLQQTNGRVISGYRYED